MASRSTARRAVARGRAAPPTTTPRLDPATAAWLAVPPAAALVLAAMVLLGPPLGDLLFPAQPFHFWGDLIDPIAPEPTEHARFLVALTAPLVLAGLTAWLLARPPALRGGAAARAALGVQVLGLLFLAVCLVVQRTYTFHYEGSAPHVVYFTVPTLLAGAALAAAAIGALRSGRLARARRWIAAESPRRRVAATGAAGLAIAISLLPAVNTDASIAGAMEAVGYHLQFTFDETLAVLDGRSPLGDFATQYSALWPYAIGGTMALTGVSLAAFTTLLAAIAGVALLALFDVLRRLARSSTAALLLFLPLLATSLFKLQGPLENRFSLANYSGTMPLRYAGPFLLAWLVARHLDGAAPRRAWPLFLAGGLVAINNAELGIPAVGGTLAALLLAGPRPTPQTLRALAAQVAIGIAAALALVAALVLVRTGAPPDLGLMLRYPRVFAAGFALLPMVPVLGLSTIMYLTYVGALGAATVRALGREPDRLLTGMLAWSGTFGLGAGSYYMGRSSPEVLMNMFPAWALALTLLGLLAIRRLAADGRLTLPRVACLASVGVLACSLAQTPTPWSQLRRLGSDGPQTFRHPEGEPFVAQLTRPGDTTAILLPLGHRIAYDLGIDDVDPYTGNFSMKTSEQLDDVLAALREAGGRKLFVWRGGTPRGLLAALPRRGWRMAAGAADGELQLWTPDGRVEG